MVNKTTTPAAEVDTAESLPEPPYVFRASGIGHPCCHKIFRESVLGLKEPISEKTQRIFDVGSAFEPLMATWLEREGWTVWYNPGSQGAEDEMEIKLNKMATIKGHHDFVIQTEDLDLLSFDAIKKPNQLFSIKLKDGLTPEELKGQRILIDGKTMNWKAFNFWGSNGTANNKPGYYMQSNIYAVGKDCSYHGILGIDKNDSKGCIEIYRTNDHIFELTSLKASMIAHRIEDCHPCHVQITLKMLPDQVAGSISERTEDSKLPSWCCGYCGFSEECKYMGEVS